MANKKKKVIAYLHTHWDREWYREFEVFRIRLIKVFDDILEMLECNKIPSFYFDGQVAALLDYLEFRPEKEELIRELIKNKKLYIGPFYCLIDEFLTDGISFKKNLEIGLKISKELGCKDFIGYLADTFGHSKNVPEILKEFDIDKAVVWRGVGDLPAEFKFNGINTVNLIRGYFMDIFSSENSIKDKAFLIKNNLDKIAEKSSNILLLPIGADHLGIPNDIAEQIASINEMLSDYEIVLGSIFDYFASVKFSKKYNDELRDNSKTFILPGAYSARTKLKQMNTLCSYKLDLANKIQKNFGSKYDNMIEYAYKLLLQNQAHDSICGCSTDKVHEENLVRYNKILQISEAIIEEIRQEQGKNISATFENFDKYKILEIERDNIEDNTQVIGIKQGFPKEILYNTSKIPVTEDYSPIYTLLKEFHPDTKESDLSVGNNYISNSNIKLEVKNGKLNVYDKKKEYKNFIEFVRYKDLGDTYNFAPDPNDEGEIAKIKKAYIVYDGNLRSQIRIETSFFGMNVFLNKQSKLLNFNIEWNNLLTNRLWQVRFNLPKEVKETCSEDMNELIKRKFDSNYNIRKNLPNTKGLEAKTNTAPMQRFVWTNGFGIITKGLTEYEVFQKSISVTILRSIGIISNPNNIARTTPAGPPIEVLGAQQLGKNSAEFSIGFFSIKDWKKHLEEVYPQTIIF